MDEVRITKTPSFRPARGLIRSSAPHHSRTGHQQQPHSRDQFSTRKLRPTENTPDHSTRRKAKNCYPVLPRHHRPGETPTVPTDRHHHSPLIPHSSLRLPLPNNCCHTTRIDAKAITSPARETSATVSLPSSSSAPPSSSSVLRRV